MPPAATVFEAFFAKRQGSGDEWFLRPPVRVVYPRHERDDTLITVAGCLDEYLDSHEGCWPIERWH
jgi:hypothetical protein